ncbi:oxidoreductase, 2OG-Fe(II) oxygenase family protein [Besnoitia besnoiti]|uniref:Oxidoreductase, 2OG-Fe(II) oxygenase family protein n=1 Tax=Besnoitia besnoiti TaxID=94643 RepID=A0A2A9MQW9_BESBE|nr:oxidoreductase, 2OG-Fe(II) oxygenase family protein [Besnoitia besnoiti]PFH38532.1 oxidoreductase, 2OG-Fe(II) oxygenase family protein [Besnoitia besnoiti]
MELDELIASLPRHLVSWLKEEADNRPVVMCTDPLNHPEIRQRCRLYTDLPSFLCDSAELTNLIDPSNTATPVVIVDNATSADVCIQAREEAETLRSAGRFRNASFGASSRKAVDSKTRSDEIVWIREQDLTALPACTRILALIEELRDALNAGFVLLGTEFKAYRTELQLSVYPSGTAGYSAHMDAGAESGWLSSEAIISNTASFQSAVQIGSP